MTAEMATNDWERRERRLEEIRRDAEKNSSTRLRIEPVPEAIQSEASAETGYYGTPALKRPQWTVEVPIYFFVGGLAGASSLIAALAQLSSADRKLIRDSRWLAAIGGLISPALLIADLGVPSRFLNMLRVFKVQSPMSVGSWTLVAFSNSAAAAAVLGEFERRRPGPIELLTNASQIVSALTGMILATYTGVLVGATAIPAWNEHVGTLPIHFAASGTASAASLLELMGNQSKALNRIALGAAVVETAMGASIELNSAPATKCCLRTGVSGWTMRGAGLLSGPLPLVLRMVAAGKSNSASKRRGLRRAAAIASLVGSLLTRWAWVHAGKLSADDPTVPLELGTATNRGGNEKTFQAQLK